MAQVSFGGGFEVIGIRRAIVIHPTRTDPCWRVWFSSERSRRYKTLARAERAAEKYARTEHGQG